MANCKICGRHVRSAKAIHAACWETVANEVAEEFCAKHCRWPRECPDEGTLYEKHCNDCVLIKALNLGL